MSHNQVENGEKRSNEDKGLSRRTFLIGAGAAAVTGSAGISFNLARGARDMSETKLKVIIKANDLKRNFLRTLLGEGLIMGFAYMWDEKNERIWPGLLEKILDLKSDFFGHLGGPGIWVHDYHWKSAIGPREKRRDPTPRFHGLDSINGKVGTHEYGLMLEEVRRATGRDIVGSIQVNVMTGTPEEAADWVEYMNGSSKTKWGGVRADNGHRDPFRVQYWELGNQPHFTFFDVGRLTGVEYANRVRTFTQAMKERDPSVKVTAYLPFFAFDGSVEEALKIGTAIEDVPGGPGSSGLTWTRLVLKEAGNLIDALDYHWYGAVNSRAMGYEFVMTSAYKGLLPNIERARAMVQEFAPSDEARERLSTFVCPEYGGLSNNGPIHQTATAVYGAVANSRLLHLFFSLDDLAYAARFGLFAPYPEPKMVREMRIPYAAIHGRPDGSDFLGTAIYEMKRLWAKAHLPRIISSRVDGGPAFSDGTPVLDVTAMGSRDGRALSLVMTNTGLQELRPSLRLEGFQPAPTAKQLTVGGDLNDDNRWEARNRVIIQEKEVPAVGDFTLTLPPHSISAVLINSF
jgi:alpha-N-arabinofuranosidase